MNVQAILLDISGVLYDGNQLIPGALDAFQTLQRSEIPYRLVTNTATQRSEQILGKLHRLGFDLAAKELVTAPSAARAYVLEHQLRPFCLLHPDLVPEFASVDQHNPNAVILGDAREGLNYENLNRAFRLCQQGCPLIGIGMNRYFSDNGQLFLDAGMFIRGIAWAADCEPVIMGKPSTAFFQQVVQSLAIPAEYCLMLGDDHEADVAGAIEAGLQAALVKTGKYQQGDEQKLPAQAHVLDSIAALPEWLENNF